VNRNKDATRDTGPVAGRSQCQLRFRLLIDALTDEKRVLAADLADLRRSGAGDPHQITQLAETLRRMLYLTEALHTPPDDSRN
jgi:hypothetical protein